MKRFSKYVNKPLNLQKIKQEDKLKNWGISVRYSPDPPEDFDEFEFGLDYENTAFLVTIEQGVIKRMLFGKPDKDNPDILRPMNDEQLSNMLQEKGEALVSFFDYVTR